VLAGVAAVIRCVSGVYPVCIRCVSGVSLVGSGLLPGVVILSCFVASRVVEGGPACPKASKTTGQACRGARLDLAFATLTACFFGAHAYSDSAFNKTQHATRGSFNGERI
jgi:hypothetical protein